MNTTPDVSGTEMANVFNRDVETNHGYQYTKSPKLSCRLATQRLLEAILVTKRLSNRSVVDIGCGDGFFTIRYWDQADPKSMVGVDAAAQAIAVANIDKENRPLQFLTGDAHHLPFPDHCFDVALLQGMLHHDADPKDIIREAFRVAPEIVILEPNGNNPGLKIIEKLSPYHRAHAEKSYSANQLKNWIRENGGRTTYECFAGFVPMFCPSGMARILKLLEPLIEALPLIKRIGCAVSILIAKRD